MAFMRKLKNMYAPKEENVKKLREYLSKQENQETEDLKKEDK